VKGALGRGDRDSVEKYLILERIAGGGMGRIYRGVKKGIGGFEKHVVLKQLLPELTEDQELVQLFFREAQIHASLDHANIVHIIDLVAAGRDYYIVMEYVRGTDLYRVIKRLKGKNRTMPLAAALYIAREVLKALDYAHSRVDENDVNLGIVHRDISPTNIMVSGAGEVKLTDFGIAKAANYSTNFFKVRGKAAYMSPEQAQGDDLDHRSDIYSTAVCLYEMLTGRRPLSTPKIGVGACEHYQQPIQPISALNSEVPSIMDELVLEGLAVDPNRRPQTAGELLSGIEQVVAQYGLFYSTRKLADFLKSLLGPDPKHWSAGAGDEAVAARVEGDRGGTADSSGSAERSESSENLAFRPPSGRRPSPSSAALRSAPAAERRTAAATKPASSGAMRRAKVDATEPPTENYQVSNGDQPIGKEVTSLSLPPFPWRAKKPRSPASLPPPSRSLLKASRPAFVQVEPDSRKDGWPPDLQRPDRRAGGGMSPEVAQMPAVSAAPPGPPPPPPPPAPVPAATNPFQGERSKAANERQPAAPRDRGAGHVEQTPVLAERRKKILDSTISVESHHAAHRSSMGSESALPTWAFWSLFALGLIGLSMLVFWLVVSIAG
jgi:serine/threonine protein kinase